MVKTKTNISASIDIEIEKKIKERAAKEDRNFSYTLNKLLKEVLNENK